MSEKRGECDPVEVKSCCYEDHGSPVRRARETARRRLPCPGCGSAEEPALRRPRHLCEQWHRDPSTHFGCRTCGWRLAAIDGPASTRPSEVAIDGIPDPEGTLRAVLTRDPLAPIRLDPWTGNELSLSLSSILGPPLAGIELRSRVKVGRPGRAEVTVPFAFLRYSIPWVLWRAAEVEDAQALPDSFAGPEQTLAGMLEVESVEAAFLVAIDRKANWQVIRLCRDQPGTVDQPDDEGPDV